MKRSYSTLTVLVADVLFASGLVAVQPAVVGVAASAAGGPLTFGLGVATFGLYIVDIGINGTSC